MMQDDSMLLILLAELTLIMFIVCLLVGVRVFLRNRKEWAAVKKLVAAVKEGEPGRRKEISALLTSRFGYKGDALEKMASKISREERRFYQALVNIYLKRDAAAVASLNTSFTRAVDPYLSLETTKTPQQEKAQTNVPQMEAAKIEPSVQAVAPSDDAAQPDDTQSSGDDSEVQRLREENERLNDELQITMSTVSRMLSEYSSMFGELESGGGEEEKGDFMNMFGDDDDD